MGFQKFFKKSITLASSAVLVLGLVTTLNISDSTINKSVADEQTVWNFSSSSSWSVPVGGTYLLEVWGAQGNSWNNKGNGGKGGYSKGNIDLEENKMLLINVGGKNGSNGGGAGSYAYTNTMNGGGATDIRVNGTALENRVIVAGGGGGGNYNANGGAGGGLSGGNGTSYNGGAGGKGGAGGTQSSGASLGNGSAGSSSSGNSAAGGGGGYYGGRGGKGGDGGSASGGGGSGYIGGVIDGQTLTGSQYVPNTVIGGADTVGKADNGYARITFIKASQTASISFPSYKTSVISWPTLNDPSIIGYRVIASASGQNDHVIEVGPTVGNVTFNNLSSGIAWSFKIEILTDSGTKEMKKESDVPVTFDDDLTSPSLILDNGTASWDPVPGVAEYQVTYYDQNGISSTQRTSSTSVTIPPGQSISVSPVSSTGSVGKSSYSTPGISSSSSPGRVGGGSSGGSGNSTSSTVSWSPVSGASSYRVTVYPPNGQNPQYIIVTDPEFTVESDSMVAVAPIIDGAPGQETPIGVPGQQVNLGNGDVLITWPLFPSSLITGYRVTAYAAGAEDIVKETDAYTDHVLFKGLDQSKDWNFTIQLLMGDDTGPEMDLGLFDYRTDPSFINGILNNDDGMVNMYVTSELTLTLEDDSVNLSDIPGLTSITPDNTMISNVRTNNITGFNVTLKSDTENLEQSNQQNQDILEFSNIKAWDKDNTNNIFNLSTSGNDLYSSDERTEDSGESITTGFNADIPWINADTYTGTVTYTATAN